MLKKVFTPEKGYCRYRDRNNCGIISHSVAERWLNFSRSTRCFLLINTHPQPPPAIPQIFQIKTLFVSRFITHSSRQITFTSVDETFSWHSFRSEFFLCNHTYQKQGRNALKGAGLFHLNIYLLQLSVFLIMKFSATGGIQNSFFVCTSPDFSLPSNAVFILRISALNSLLLERMGWSSLYVFNYIN